MNWTFSHSWNSSLGYWVDYRNAAKEVLWVQLPT